MAEEGELDLNSLPDDELVQQMHDDLYDGLKEEIEEAAAPPTPTCGRPAGASFLDGDCRSAGPTALPPRDREVRLTHAACAATEGPDLLDEQQRLVTVRPADEEAPVAEDLEVHGALGLGRERRLRGRGSADVAWTGAAQVPVRQDALVPVGPLDAQRVAPDLLQPLDVSRVGVPTHREARLMRAAGRGQPGVLKHLIRSID